MTVMMGKTMSLAVVEGVDAALHHQHPRYRRMFWLFGWVHYECSSHRACFPLPEDLIIR